jgi:NAD(P)-dependent dehydrogenase (short-subunit alcohol dehydrogenase family)
VALADRAPEAGGGKTQVVKTQISREIGMSHNPFRLDGRTAIVVGAAHGIGKAIATAFAGAGAAVACLDADAAAAERTAGEIEAVGAKAIGHRIDVTTEASVNEAVAAVVKALGAPRVLVNGAAAREPTGTICEVGPEWWNHAVAVNFTGAYLTSRAVIPHMAAAGGGSIIHIASQMGRIGAAGRGVYCATKGALIQLAKVMAVDHASQNIRVNTLSPGAVETDRIVFRHGSIEAARKASVPLHPIGRLGRPDEIGNAALFLASDAAPFMTGADLLVDGGYTAV